MERIGETDWPMWIITGRLNAEAASCARRNPSRSLVPATFSDNRALTPTTTSRLRAIAPRAKDTFARLMSISSPPVKPVRVAMLSRARPICGPPRTTAAISSMLSGPPDPAPSSPTEGSMTRPPLISRS
jgi:hypothetical protein